MWKMGVSIRRESRSTGSAQILTNMLTPLMEQHGRLWVLRGRMCFKKILIHRGRGGRSLEAERSRPYPRTSVPFGLDLKASWALGGL